MAHRIQYISAGARTAIAGLSRRSKAGLALVLTAAAVLVPAAVMAAPAQALPDDCPTSYVCFWKSPTAVGIWDWKASGFINYQDLPPSIHDQVGSVVSKNTSRTMCLREWVNGVKQTVLTIHPGEKYYYLQGTAARTADAIDWC